MKKKLYQEALVALETAHAPYGQFFVGAAASLANGTVVSASNMENSSYGLTLCVECGLVSGNIRRGRSAFQAVLILGRGQLPGSEKFDEPATVLPCGRCRAILSEHATETTFIYGSEGELNLRQELLPFG